MANSLEVRAPLLDHELVEWLASLPASVKLRDGIGKYMFKKALEPLLPRDILYRPKQGFSVPLARWFRQDLRDRVAGSVIGERMLDCGLFNPDTLRRLVGQHQSGLVDNSESLWLLYMFESFLRGMEAAGAPSENAA